MSNDNNQKTPTVNIVLDVDTIVGKEVPFVAKDYDLGAMEIDLKEIFEGYGTSKKK